VLDVSGTSRFKRELLLAGKFSLIIGVFLSLKFKLMLWLPGTWIAPIEPDSPRDTNEMKKDLCPAATCVFFPALLHLILPCRSLQSQLLYTCITALIFTVIFFPATLINMR
jgi:hypothetical protein